MAASIWGPQTPGMDIPSGPNTDVLPITDNIYDLGSASRRFNDIHFGGSLNGGVFNEAQGADIASAASVNLDTATGNLIDITGVVGPITSIVLSAGRERITRFTAATSITTGALLVLQGIASGITFTVTAGDYAIWRGYAGGIVRLIGGTIFQSILANTNDVSDGDARLGVIGTQSGDVATNQHQVNEERSSVFRKMTATQILAISTEVGTADAICSDALQTALNTMGLCSLPVGRYLLDKPLRILNGTSRTTIRGDSRIRSALVPSAVNIAVAPVSINSIFIIQDNNAHFCVENVRWHPIVGYTGVFGYSVEGGGADASAQVLFSGIFRNLWIEPPSTNGGFWTGCTNNTVFDTITGENLKGVFNLVGVGSADNHYRNFSFYNCYDHLFLQTADTNGSALMSVSGINFYTHMRGRIFDVQNWTASNISNIVFEAAVGNLGNTGVFKFKDSSGLIFNNFQALTRSGVPACAVGIEIEAVSAKFSQGYITADVGLKISGTGANAVEFVNVDFTLCTTAALQIVAAATGTIKTYGCKFNDSTINGVLTSAANALNWFSYNDECLNAGLGGSAGARNITLESSGRIVFTNLRIGQNNGSAAAAYYIEANGTGTVELVNPEWVGTPPTGLITGSQAVTIKQTWPTDITTVVAATHPVTDSERTLIINNAGTCTLTLPTPSLATIGKPLDIQTITANTVISASSNVIPITGGAAATAILPAVDGAHVSLVCTGTAWQITNIG